MQPMVMSGDGGEAEFFCAEKRGDGDVASGHQFAVGLDTNAAAQVVQQQYLLRFGEAEFPGNARMLDRTDGRCAGAAAVAADEHDIGMGLGYSGSDRANADFCNQLHRDARLADSRFSDRRSTAPDLRWNKCRGAAAEKSGPRRRLNAATRAMYFVHFMAGELAAFAGFGALRHFDLQFVGVDQVIGGDAEAARRQPA